MIPALCCALLSTFADADVHKQQELQAMEALYRARNYFELAERIDTYSPTDPGLALFYRAAVLNAFNKPQESNDSIHEALNRKDIPDSLRDDLLTMKLYNSLRLHRYQDAARASAEALRLPDLTEVRRRDLQNMNRLAEALREVAPQHTVKHRDSELELIGQTHLALTVNGQGRDYAYDTGANYSTLMLSEARSLELRIIEAEIVVGSSSDVELLADLAVADSVRIGGIDFANVVFLVVPDEVLTFPDGFQVRGLIGFPMLEAMGEIRFRKDGTLFVPVAPPRRELQNLALADLTPLIKLEYGGDVLVGRLDTGSTRTIFYESFFKRYFAADVDPARIDSVRAGSAGSVRTFTVYRPGEIDLTLGGTSILLQDATCMMNATGSASESYLFANIGLDLLSRFDEYIVNFRDMALVLKPD